MSHIIESYRRHNFIKKSLNIPHQNNALSKYVNKNIIIR